MKVTLIGENGMEHFVGELDSDTVATANILVRNGHYYVMRFFNHLDNSIVFQETLIPWDISAIMK